MIRFVWRLAAPPQQSGAVVCAAAVMQCGASGLLRREGVRVEARRELFAECMQHIARDALSEVNRNYILTKSQLAEERKEQSPDFVIAGLQDIWQKRLRVNLEIFVHSILQPLEAGNDALVDYLRRAADSSVPFLLGLCGRPMSNATNEEKTAVANRFWEALIINNIKITLRTLKIHLSTMIENEQTFDAWKILKEAEATYDLVLDEDFFSLLVQELSLIGDVKSLDSMLAEVKRRQLSTNMFMKASQIYCYLKGSDSEAVKILIQNALTEFGNDIEPLILKARCVSALERGDILQFRTALDMLLSCLPAGGFTDESVVELVWLLARNSSDSLGREHERFCTEILRKVKKEHGFLKIIVREAERHAVHGLFYSALSYLHNDLHANNTSNSEKDKVQDLGRHIDWITCFSKALINADLPYEEMKSLIGHINRNTHQGKFLLERILLCILTHRYCSSDKRLLVTLELLKLLDPICAKIHTILPLLTRASTVQERLKILAKFVEVGYKDVGYLNYGIIRSLVLQPILEKTNPDKNLTWTTERLSRVVGVFAKHNVPESVLRKFMNSAAFGDISMSEFAKVWAGGDTSNPNDKNILSLDILKKYISDGKMDKLHEYIMKNGLPSISPQLFQSLFMMYDRLADWSTLMEFVQWICKDSTYSTSITAEHVLMILSRHIEQNRDLNMSFDFVHQLQQIVPRTSLSYRNERVARKLVRKCIELPHPNIDSLISCAKLFEAVAEAKWIQSGPFETISYLFVAAALAKFGFEAALKVCDPFQFLNFPNGVVCLLHYAAGNEDKKLVNKALAVARTYWPEWKVFVTFAAVLISLGNLDEASLLLQKVDIRWVNALQTYHLMCALHLDEARYFHFNYINLFSKALGYDRNDCSCVRMTSDCLKNCTRMDPEQARLLKILFEENSMDAVTLQKK